MKPPLIPRPRSNSFSSASPRALFCLFVSVGVAFRAGEGGRQREEHTHPPCCPLQPHPCPPAPSAHTSLA
eukprot:2801223-Rhodomonas_salina.1